jgi:hypothetical protein
LVKRRSFYDEILHPPSLQEELLSSDHRQPQRPCQTVSPRRTARSWRFGEAAREISSDSLDILSAGARRTHSGPTIRQGTSDPQGGSLHTESARIGSEAGHGRCPPMPRSLPVAVSRTRRPASRGTRSSKPPSLRAS